MNRAARRLWKRRPKVEVWTPVGGGMFYRAPGKLSRMVRTIGLILYVGCIALGLFGVIGLEIIGRF